MATFSSCSVLTSFLVTCLTIVAATPGCNLTVLDHQTKHYKTLPMITRDTTSFFTEYSVSFSKTNDSKTTNGSKEMVTSRFQPRRWFNVHNNATMELQLMYDSYFDILKWLFIFEVHHVILDVTPADCLDHLEDEEKENMTRNFILQEFQLPNFELCSAHIGEHDGEGKVVFRCCKMSAENEANCHLIEEGDLLFKLHIFSVIVALFVLIVITICIFRIDFGYEKFQFRPDGLKLQLLNDSNSQNSSSAIDTNNTKPLIIPRDVFDRMTKLKKCLTEEQTQYEIRSVETILLLVNKKRCITEGETSISFIRSIAESLLYAKSVIKKTFEKMNGCCSRCGYCCCSYFGCMTCERVLIIVFLLLLYLPSVPLLYLRFDAYADYKLLCSEYKARDLSCPFYLIGDDYIMGVIISSAVFYLLGCIGLVVSACKPIWSCKRHRMMRKILNVFIACCLFFTWGLGLHFVIYSIVRAIATSSVTKNTFDDVSPMILPLLFYMKDRIQNVSKRYVLLVKSVLKVIYPQTQEVTHGLDLDQNVETSPSQTINGRDNEGLQSVSSGPAANNNQPELSTQENEQNSTKIDKPLHLAVTINDGPSTQGKFKVIVSFEKLRLLVSQPMVFIRDKGDLLLSKKFILRLFNRTIKGFFSPYAKVFLLSCVSCLVFILIFYLFVTYGTVHSYSNAIVGNVAFFLTFLNILKEQFSDSPVQDVLLPDTSFLNNLQEHVKYYRETWTIKDITLKKVDQLPQAQTEIKSDDDILIQFKVQDDDDRRCICRTNSVEVLKPLKNRHSITILPQNNLKAEPDKNEHRESTRI
ncbi:hypothetical protein Bpfe_006609 [Biomphalaria pfeifferi]|uniref:Uncharacterized protein n=1 Tax=Biomphalaria pfeifferi TaxID=112525 RepID=A0AAD8C1Y8_BIOPF|nr:hypothetical protein Bpfe_006609 [Biomphalaria pfeifferi]